MKDKLRWICEECGGDMTIGVMLNRTFKPQFGFGRRPSDELVECMKCRECGHSKELRR
jgi:hypothetical protein